MNDYILFKNIDGKYLTLKDCIEENKKDQKLHQETDEDAREAEETEEASEEKKEPEKTTIFYVTDEDPAEPVYQYVP